MEEQSVQSTNKTAVLPLARRLGDVFLFISVVALSCFAVIAVALAAPFVLAASAFAGLFSKGGASRGWRPAGA